MTKQPTQSAIIMDILNSIKENRQQFRYLELEASVRYGDKFWRDIDFQLSDIAKRMAWYNAEINHYIYRFDVAIDIHLN